MRRLGQEQWGPGEEGYRACDGLGGVPCRDVGQRQGRQLTTASKGGNMTYETQRNSPLGLRWSSPWLLARLDGRLVSRAAS